jgi:hypothetical protein
MTITYYPVALLLVLSLTTPTVTQQSLKKHGTQEHASGIEGHETVAPPWSAACMTDHGPSECGEPMWIYGSSNSNAHARSTNGF